MQAETYTNPSQQKPTRITLDNEGLAALARNVEVSFRPIWNVEKNYLCGYMIRAVKKAHETPDMAASADLGLLVKAAEALESLQERGEKSVVVVTIGYETLNTYPFRGHYLSLLRRIPEALCSFIVLQLDNIPEKAPKQRLQLLQNDMRGLCRAVAMSCDIRGGNIENASGGQLHACVVNFSGAEIEEALLVSMVSRFADKVGGVNCAAMADGVATRTALDAALGAGFRYIAGSAIAPDQQQLGISRREFTISDALQTA